MGGVAVVAGQAGHFDVPCNGNDNTLGLTFRSLLLKTARS